MVSWEKTHIDSGSAQYEEYKCAMLWGLGCNNFCPKVSLYNIYNIWSMYMVMHDDIVDYTLTETAHERPAPIIPIVPFYHIHWVSTGCVKNRQTQSSGLFSTTHEKSIKRQFSYKFIINKNIFGLFSHLIKL